MSLRLRVWIAAVVLAVLDQVIKEAVLGRFETGERLNVLPFFDLILLHNPGAAFSFLADFDGGQRYFLLAVTVIAIGLIHRWLVGASARVAWSLMGILAGALGNGVDRLIHGTVTDYLLFYWNTWYYPAFNLADIAITLGAIGLILDSILEYRRERANHRT